MPRRQQRGWLKKERRIQGETWVLYFRTTRKSDGRRVENKIPIGLVHDLPDKSTAWAEVGRLHLQINPVDFRRGVTFGDLALHYAEHELVERSESIHPKAHTTIKGYNRVLRNRLLPKWGNRIALGIEPLEVEQWLKALKSEEDLANPTLDRMRRVMSMVYRHGQRYGLISRSQESNPMRFVRCKTTSGYEAMILNPQQAYAIVRNLRESQRTLTLLAAGTGLRISECLGLQWQDVNFADAMIHVRRTWTCGRVGLPKTKASQGPVPLHPLLAEFMFRWKQKTPYPKPGDWVFPSLRLKGKQPRVANMLVEDHLRPAAANGMQVDEFAPRLAFYFVSQTDFFEEIAKFRAARRAYAKIMRDRFGAKNPESMRLRFHCQTAAATLTKPQPMVNIIRTTLQALAAVLGGAQSLHTNGMDEAYAIPTEEAMKIALRTQQVIADESYVANVVDPIGGSYFVESLTAEYERKIFEILDEIERLGGTMKLIQEGWFQKRIADFAYDQALRKQDGEKVVIGVNCFQEPEERVKIETHPYDSTTERRQIERLRRVRRERDNTQVNALLDRLIEVAKDQCQNIMPVTIDLVRAGATMGDIVERLKKLWGTYRERPVF